MPEMPHSCHHQRQVGFLTIVDTVLIPDRTARLNESCNTSFMAELYTIIEGEKGIRCHNSTIQIKVELLCLFNSMA